MDWRAFIPHALVSGGIFGGLVAVVLVPILMRRDTRQRRREIESLRKKLEAAAPFDVPAGEPIVPHKKWTSLRRLWKGYYGSE